MQNIAFTTLTPKEYERIRERWKKDRKTLYAMLLATIAALAGAAYVTFFVDSKVDFLTMMLYTSGIVLFFVSLIVGIYFSSSARKDCRHRQKFIIQAVLKVHEYRLRTPFVNIPLAQNLPFPIHHEVEKLKYINTLGSSSSGNNEQSRFIFRLKGGLKYIIYEMAFLSDNPGTYLELHVARFSGRVLSVKKLKSTEIDQPDVLAGIMQSLYSEDDFLEKIDELYTESDPDEPIIIEPKPGEDLSIDELFGNKDTKQDSDNNYSNKKPDQDDGIPGPGPAGPR